MRVRKTWICLWIMIAINAVGREQLSLVFRVGPHVFFFHSSVHNMSDCVRVSVLAHKWACHANVVVVEIMSAQYDYSVGWVFCVCFTDTPITWNQSWLPLGISCSCIRVIWNTTQSQHILLFLFFVFTRIHLFSVAFYFPCKSTLC